MDLTGLQEDSAKVANAVLREQHFVVGFNHGNSSSTISRFRKLLEVWHVSSQRSSISRPIEARDQKTWDSNRSLARVESKTACAGAGIRSTSKSSLMIRRISKSLGAGFAGDKTTPNEDTAESSA